MNPDIIIPSIRTREELSPLVCDIEGFSFGCRVIVSSSLNSAAYNRNRGLEQATSDIVIMVDDDIRGFYDGWIGDMASPFYDEHICMVSARLLRKDGSIGEMNGSLYQVDGEYEYVTAFPSACIAFRLSDAKQVMFHEGFRGSGFEDTLFCDKMRALTGKDLVINNRCRLIHWNEMKNQVVNFAHNEAEYRRMRAQ